MAGNQSDMPTPATVEPPTHTNPLTDLGYYIKPKQSEQLCKARLSRELSEHTETVGIRLTTNLSVCLLLSNSSRKQSKVSKLPDSKSKVFLWRHKNSIE